MKCITEREQLIISVRDLKEEAVRELVLKRIEAGDDPLYIIDDCQQGMRLVGERYEQGQYYIAALIMAGEIFRQVMTIVQPLLKSQASKDSKGSVLLGTVQEDIHDLGKNILNILLTCHGFTVYDLGVDVPPARFVESVQQLQPDIVGLSGLLTVSHNKMKKTIALLKETSNIRKNIPVIIGGGQIDKQVANSVGTDLWCNDAIEGVRLCQQLVAVKTPLSYK
ncbi:MAG: cobalamin-dependent protein [Bacillota bacterium]